MKNKHIIGSERVSIVTQTVNCLGYLLGLWRRPILKLVVLIACVGFVACNEDEADITYIDSYSTLYSFMEDNEDFSLYKEIVDAAIIDGTSQTMESVYTSYNSNTDGENLYTLFLPSNDAIESYLLEKNISIDELLSSAEDCWDLVANHLIDVEIYSRDFPNGELSGSSLNGESHTVRYEENDDEVVYYIDETATVLIADNYVSNGVIHVIDEVLIPISYTSSEWLESNDEYSIFYEALNITGLSSVLQNLDPDVSPYTIFVESDVVFQEAGINSIDDLIAQKSPDQNNYTDETNLLYEFVAFHLIEDRAIYFTDMSDGTTNYETYTTYPLSITLDSDLSQEEEDLSVGIALNKGFVVYDTIVSEYGDTTLIDYVSIYDAESNKPTMSGVMHFVNYMLEVDTIFTSIQVIDEFIEDPAILAAQEDLNNNFNVFDDDQLVNFEFGGELDYLLYYRSDDEDEVARSSDYISFYGFFELSYTTTRIIQGNYTLALRLNANRISGLVEVYFDGKKTGSTINMDAIEITSNANPYNIYSVGSVQIEGYEEHVVTFKSVTYGYVTLDYIRFTPID
jgi:uncharacterized surface protein with fasciclin (FAS1) repeats